MDSINNFFEFKYKFVLGRIRSFFSSKTILNKFLFVTHAGSEDWILGAKARRLSRNFTGDSDVLYTGEFKNMPKVSGAFFLHQNYFAKALRYNPHLRESRNIVMFTHPQWNKFYSRNHIAYALQSAYHVVCLNSSVKEELQSIGVPAEKISIFHMASDPSVFSIKAPDKTNTVGFCCYYSERKNPELIYDLVFAMPHCNFILIGQNWQNYPKFNELLAAANFTYYGDEDYSKYPELYAKMNVFVSASHLEGGPVPLLEAMMCNIVPVSSTTGFCPDIITHGENGYLFDSENDGAAVVSGLIDKALHLNVDVRNDVVSHSWENYGKKIYDLAMS